MYIGSDLNAQLVQPGDGTEGIEPYVLTGSRTPPTNHDLDVVREKQKRT